MATGDTLKATKAYVAAVLGFLAPGAGFLILASKDGITSTEWLLGVPYCVTAAGATGVVVHQVENRPKTGAQP